MPPLLSLRSERKIVKRRRRHTIGDPKDLANGDFKMSADDLVDSDWMTITTKNTTPTLADEGRRAEDQTPRSVPR